MAYYLIVLKKHHQKGNPKFPHIHFTFSHVVNCNVCKTLLRFLNCIRLVHTLIYFALRRGKYFWIEVKAEGHNSCKFYSFKKYPLF